jgi:hemolysin III
MALIGVVISFFGNRIKRWLRTTFYIGMGWVAVLVFPALISTLPLHSLALLLLGGLLYTAGAVIYAIKRPDPMPRWFGFHEIFHLFVIAGGLAFTVHIFLWVLPYPRT